MMIYENNIQVLKEKHVELYKAYREIEIETLLNPQCEKTKDGDLTIKIVKDEREIYMNSRYCPQNEAEKFVKQYEDIPDYAFMLFIGMGNGTVIRELKKQKGQHVHFLYYEPSLELFDFVLKNYDITDILKDKNIRIYIKGLNETSMEVDLRSFVSPANYKICYYDALPKYRLVFPEDDKWMENVYRYAVTSVQSNIATMVTFGKEICKNNINNLKYLLDSNCEEDFAGVFPLDMPVIVVAAGPSLEKNISVLKELKGHAFIIAVDTALRYLVEERFFPDLAVSVDPEKPIRLFEHPEIQQIPLALATTLGKDVVSLMSKGKLVYAIADNPYYDTLYQIVGKHIYLLPNGGSVATVATAMAMNWGFKRIILVGQDLALAADKVHAGKDDVDLEKLDGKKIAIEGYYGETVYTTRDFHQYKEWYEQIVRTNPDVEIINATEGGAKIQGAVQMSLQEVKDQYCQKFFDFEGTIRSMPPTFTGESIEYVKAFICRSVRNLYNMERLFKDGIRECKEGLRIIERGQFEPGKIRKINKKIDSIIKKCTSMDEIYFVDCMVSEEDEDILGDIYEVQESQEQEYHRLLEKLHNYMSNMLEAVDEVSRYFQEVVQEGGLENK